MILDTSFLIALDEGDDDAIALAREQEAAGIPQRLPATTLTELYVSVGAGKRPNRNARKYEELIGNLPIVDVDANIARRAGTEFRVHLEHDEKPDIGFRDATIAATGLVYNEPVVTADTDDFEAVDGLQVVTW
ncbi:PIN domain-containing protein [Salinarchaeum laminariae]|uniref:PIN domain-containing protein n=1 Tax=Salinarchaeum laminariae TaxID=869888 RepID=UPI0020C13D3F|nr:PIN domain-containing protein [Salinarchaeum laminariae]